MSRITDYSFVFQGMPGLGGKSSGKINAIGNFRLFDLDSAEVQRKLKLKQRL